MNQPKKSHKWQEFPGKKKDMYEMDCKKPMFGMEKKIMHYHDMDMGHLCPDEMAEDMHMHHHPMQTVMSEGQMPSPTLLAHAYVPWQCYTEAFSPQEALKKGTLFPELYGPYKPPV